MRTESKGNPGTASKENITEEVADMLQMAGLDIDKNAVQRIENGKRFVTDIELKVIAKVLGVSYKELLDS